MPYPQREAMEAASMGTSAAEREKDISREMNLLDQAICQQAELVGMLDKRLDSLARDDPEEACKGGSVEAHICSFAATLREYRYAVEGNSHIVSRLLRTLEL